MLSVASVCKSATVDCCYNFTEESNCREDNLNDSFPLDITTTSIATTERDGCTEWRRTFPHGSKQTSVKLEGPVDGEDNEEESRKCVTLK